MYLRTSEGLGQGATPLQAQRGRVLLPSQGLEFRMALEEIRKHQSHEDDLKAVVDKFTPTPVIHHAEQ